MADSQDHRLIMRAGCDGWSLQPGRWYGKPLLHVGSYDPRPAPRPAWRGPSDADPAIQIQGGKYCSSTSRHASTADPGPGRSGAWRDRLDPADFRPLSNGTSAGILEEAIGRQEHQERRLEAARLVSRGWAKRPALGARSARPPPACAGTDFGAPRQGTARCRIPAPAGPDAPPVQRVPWDLCRLALNTSLRKAGLG